MNKETLKLDNLAQQPNQEAYIANPIQNYGMNLLKGMGFDQKRGTRNGIDDKTVEVLVLKPRPKGLGLGAETNQNILKQNIQIGDRVKITKGSHKQMAGFVIQIIDENQVSIQLFPSNSKVKASKSAIEKINKKEMEKLAENLDDDVKKKKKKLKWVLPYIRVKIVDRNSKFYLQKVIVTDITGERQFQCVDQSGKTHNQLCQKDLQTVIPKPDGIVLILRGDKKGVKAKLIQRKKSKSMVTVQTLDQLQILKLQDDNVSQYVEL